MEIKNIFKSFFNNDKDQKKSISDYLTHWSEVSPDAIAMLAPGRKATTYAELSGLIKKYSKIFADAGIKEREKVALYVSGPAEFVVASLSLMEGTICVPMPSQLTPEEARRIFSTLGIQALVTDSPLPSPITVVAAELGIKMVFIVAETDKSCGTFRFLIPPVTDVKAWTKPSPDETCLILQTTGSTAQPKIVPITMEAIVITCTGSTRSLELTPEDRCLNFMTLNHVHGLISSTYLPLVSGGSCILAGSFEKNNFFSWLEELKPTWFSTAPAIYRDILKITSEYQHVLKNSKLRFIRVGSASLTPQLAKQLEEVFGVQLIEAYGMSETLQITGIPVNNPRPGSVGKSIAPEIGILNEKGGLCKPFEVGAIAVKGKTVMKGYLNNTEANAEAFFGKWFRTGDLGWLDKEGYLYLTGRIKEMINKGGEKIAPAEIEKILVSHPSVEEAVAFGIPHSGLGEDLAAAVVLHKNKPVDEDELKIFMSKQVSVHKIPSRIIIVEKFNKSENGKIVRRHVADSLLPEIKKSLSGSKSVPETNEEKYVAAWFSRLLKKSDIGPDDDFFAQGGTSLDAAELIAGIGKELGELIHGITFMRTPTIRAYARFLQSNYAAPLGKLLGESQTSENVNFKRDLTDEDIVQFREKLPQVHKGKKVKKISGLSPVFLLCCSRSGSTLLRAILAGHSGIFSPPELRLLNFSTMGDWKRGLSGEFTFYQEGLIRAAMAAFNMSLEQATEWVNAEARKDTPVEKIYQKISKATGNKIIVDKTPHYSIDPSILRHMEEAFDNPRYIYLLRNPLDMQRSFTKAHLEQLWMYDHRFTPEQLAELAWHESYHNIDDFLKDVPAERQVKIYFEDLVSYPDQIVHNICSFLRLDYEENMINPQDDPSKRMTDGTLKGSAMIGDPFFFKHKGIDAKSAVSGFVIPKESGLSPAIINKAVQLGYKDASAEEQPGTATNDYNGLPFSIIEQQRKLFKLWNGVRRKPESLIAGQNVSGKNIPLFWCFVSGAQPDDLAATLGPDQPLYSMRAGHLLFKRDEEMIDKLAGYYIQEMLKILPEGPFIIGGNCQGARVSWSIAKQLLEMGHEVPLLLLMELNKKEPYPGRIALIYGKDSATHNPYLMEKDPEADWKKFYGSFSVDIVRGAHGEYFSNKKNLADLSAKVAARLKECMENLQLEKSKYKSEKTIV